MSWQKTPVKHQKIKFISDWLEDEYTFTALCKRYQISRQCGYELINRYRKEGEEAFEVRSHARLTHPNQTPEEIRKIILESKYRFLTWGPVTIKAWLEEEHRNEIWPSASTIGNIFNQEGLVKKRYLRKRVPAYTEPLKNCKAPNQVWSADYKGQFKMTNEQYCYPLTITDNFSRYLFCCDAFDKIEAKKAIKSFEKAFYAYGMPDAIRTDNGYPFAGTAIGGLSRLSIWLLKLDILPERIEPGCPQQNPRHERMHRTLKAGIKLNTRASIQKQQRWFDQFKKEFNEQRPHQGLDLKRPADLHQCSNKTYPSKLPEVIYPSDFLVRNVRSNGQIKYFGKKYFLSELLYGETVGLKIIDEARVMVYFGRLKLGMIDAKLDKIFRL